jgi:hypothetical protein
MTIKFPPPPQLPISFGGFGQRLNRWLIEIQSILDSQGLIDPSNVNGLPALFTQVATLAGEVATLTAEVATNTADIVTNTANIATLTAEVAANSAAITALQARNQILNGAGVPISALGNNGDMYINNTGGGIGANNNLYAKIGGAWSALA